MNISDTLQNEDVDLAVNASFRELGHQIKQSARTFISRSKKMDKSSNSESMNKQSHPSFKTVVQVPKSYRPISEYITNMHKREANPQNFQLSKRSYESTKPACVPPPVAI
jgi:hypothetical protein